MVQKICLTAGLVLFVVIGGITLAWNGPGEGQEKEKERAVTLDQVPAPVKATILREAGKNKILELEEVVQDGGKFYEAVWMKDGKEIEIKIAPGGKLLGKEEEEKEEGEEEEKVAGESERKVTEAEVPAPALAALKKLAAGARITEFAEEVEHGHTFYEGSWKAASGANRDVLVTASGDLVEIEEEINADQVPGAVLKAARKAAGKEANLGLEKKTMVLYEIRFQKHGRRHELLLTPDGRPVEEAVEKGKRAEEEEEEKEGEEKEENEDE